MSVLDIRIIGSVLQRTSPSQWRTILGTFVMSKFALYDKPAYGFFRFYKFCSKQPFFRDFNITTFLSIILSKCSIDGAIPTSSTLHPVPEKERICVDGIPSVHNTKINESERQAIRPMLDPSVTTTIREYLSGIDSDCGPKLQGIEEEQINLEIPTNISKLTTGNVAKFEENLKIDAEPGMSATPDERCVDDTPNQTVVGRKRTRKKKSSASSGTVISKRTALEPPTLPDPWLDVVGMYKQMEIPSGMKVYRNFPECARLKQVSSILISKGCKKHEAALTLALGQDYICYISNSVNLSTFVTSLVDMCMGKANYVFNGAADGHECIENLKRYLPPIDSCCQAVAAGPKCVCSPLAILCS